MLEYVIVWWDAVRIIHASRYTLELPRSPPRFSLSVSSSSPTYTHTFTDRPLHSCFLSSPILASSWLDASSCIYLFRTLAPNCRLLQTPLARVARPPPFHTHHHHHHHHRHRHQQSLATPIQLPCRDVHRGPSNAQSYSVSLDSLKF